MLQDARGDLRAVLDQHQIGAHPGQIVRDHLQEVGEQGLVLAGQRLGEPVRDSARRKPFLQPLFLHGRGILLGQGIEKLILVGHHDGMVPAEAGVHLPTGFQQGRGVVRLSGKDERAPHL